MNTNKKNIGLDNGWILCPSKSFPGKFYYFNVLNGETAWCLNEADKKTLPNDTRIANKSHDYPEPTSLPNETSDSSPVTTYQIRPNLKNLIISSKVPRTEQPSQQPMFGKPVFPNYVANTDTFMPNIVWTPLQLPMPVPMYCPETKRPMSDKKTQTSEMEQQLYTQTSNIPLCKRFKNYENPALCFDKVNKMVYKPVLNIDRSPIKSLYIDNRPQALNHIPKSNYLLDCELPNTKIPEMKKMKTNIKPTLSHCKNVENSKTDMIALKIVQKVPDTKLPDVVKNKGQSIYCNKVESTKIDSVSPNIDQEENILLNNLERNDLRFLLLAKRRQSIDSAMDEIVERKRPKPIKEISPIKPKKKVTFDLTNISDDDDVMMSDLTEQEHFTPLTPEPTQDYLSPPLSPIQNIQQATSTPIPSGVNNYSETQNVPTLCIKKSNSVPKATSEDTWFIVGDTDVLLLDFTFIEELVLSDNKCKLLIPHVVKQDIEALCVGDCRGQQRVINARQITRKLLTPPSHYMVEAEPNNEEDIVVVTNSILQCCVNAVNDNHNVVLITNDPHLQAKASSLNIPSYKLNEIKNIAGLPDVTSELDKIKIRILNDDSTKNDISSQNKNFLFGNKITVKKQLFADSNRDVIKSDKLIDITKPKPFSMYDSGMNTYLNKEVNNSNLIERKIMKSQNETGIPIHDRNVCKINENEDAYINYEKNIQNSNYCDKLFDIEKTVQNSKLKSKTNTIPTSNYEIQYSEKEMAIKNTQSTENMFNSNPISNMKKYFQNPLHTENKTKFPKHNSMPFDNKITKMNISLKNESHGTSRQTPMLNLTQTRLKKLFNNIKLDSTIEQEKEENNTKTNNSTDIFKVPQLIQFKNRTTNRSAPDECSAATDKIMTREFKNINSINETLRRFRVKSKIMSEKLSSRMDEWMCSYTQIMEDILNDILQKNSESMKNTIVPLTLNDTLNCIKMLYDSHSKVRDAVNNLSDLLNRHISIKGKSTPLKPEEFMKMFGYGFFLISSLEEIESYSEDFKDAASHLSTLLYIIESTSMELDPELSKTPFVSRAEVDDRDEQQRSNFTKDKSYVINYLKKHYKDWASYDEQTVPNIDKSENRSEIKVVRTFGKNLSLLKFDNMKTMSLSKDINEADFSKENEEEITGFIEDIKPTKENINTIGTKQNEPKFYKEQNIFLNNTDNLNNDKVIESKYFTKSNTIITDQNVLKVSKLQKNNKPNILEENPQKHEHVFKQNIEKVEPKVIRNIKIIDKYEDMIKNRKPLDLDLLDYSAMLSDITSKNSDNSDNILENNENDNCNDNSGPDNTKSTLDNLTEDTNSFERNKYEMSPILGSKNYTFMSRKDNSTHLINKPINDNYFYHNKNDKIERANFGTENETDNDNSRMHNDNSGFHNDNSEMHNDNDNFDKITVIRDDITSDSGFENDSTYAHSVVKIFLNELSTSFKVIYKFINKFINEICDKEFFESKKSVLHDQAVKSLEDTVAIVQRLKSIIKRESSEDTVLRSLLLKAGVEATTDKRITRYRQIVIKSLEQAQILENALRIIVSTTIGDFEALSTTADSITSSIRYFNIFE